MSKKRLFYSNFYAYYFWFDYGLWCNRKRRSSFSKAIITLY